MPSRIYEATWGRGFASGYNTAFALAERHGLRDVRSELVGQAKGRVVEIGAGTGLNLEHYSGEISDLVLTEPDRFMAAKLRQRAKALPLDPPVLEAPAERLPLADHSANTVVSTLVLCTVKDLGLALAEIARVLRPGGTFLFAEHVRSASPRSARWQDRLRTPWSWYACGCQCNRDTVAAIEAASFQISEIRNDRLRWISPVVRPLVVGSATAA
jgi:ubiquinone/menaquinone biosynthesis C-methylase UbiE